jgi:hypothetical protein
MLEIVFLQGAKKGNALRQALLCIADPRAQQGGVQGAFDHWKFPHRS